MVMRQSLWVTHPVPKPSSVVPEAPLLVEGRRRGGQGRLGDCTAPAPRTHLQLAADARMIVDDAPVAECRCLALGLGALAYTFGEPVGFNLVAGDDVDAAVFVVDDAA